MMFKTLNHSFNKFPLIMGIVNITPDSFFSGSRKETQKEILEQVEKHLKEGADIIDIGAESTRPGARPVSLEDEKKRILPNIISIKKYFPETIVSVDTYKSEIAKEAIINGADIINDISGFDFDSKIVNILQQYKPGYILMHIKGTPQNMQKNPYYDNVIQEITEYFQNKTKLLIEKGLPKNNIVIDPGIGFGKNDFHNLAIISNIDKFKNLGFPILIGLSRKSFIGRILDLQNPDDRLNGTSIMHSISLYKGANILRVHDVKFAKEAVKLITELKKVENAI